LVIWRTSVLGHWNSQFLFIPGKGRLGLFMLLTSLFCPNEPTCCEPIGYFVPQTLMSFFFRGPHVFTFSTFETLCCSVFFFSRSLSEYLLEPHLLFPSQPHATCSTFPTLSLSGDLFFLLLTPCVDATPCLGEHRGL